MPKRASFFRKYAALSRVNSNPIENEKSGQRFKASPEKGRVDSKSMALEETVQGFAKKGIRSGETENKTAKERSRGSPGKEFVWEKQSRKLRRKDQGLRQEREV